MQGDLLGVELFHEVRHPLLLRALGGLRAARVELGAKLIVKAPAPAGNLAQGIGDRGAVGCDLCLLHQEHVAGAKRHRELLVL